MKEDFDTTLKDFSAFLKLERSFSQNTILSYCSDCRRLFDFLISRNYAETPEDALPEHLEAFVADRVKEGIKKRSQARLISSLNALYHFLESEGRLKGENPCLSLTPPKINPNLPTVLTYDEIVSILDAVDLSRTYGHRDRAVLEVLYSCGLRVSEAVNLKISDIFFKEQFVRVTGKGDKQRLVPIGEPALKSIRLWMDIRRRLPVQGKAEDFLFLNRRGTPLTRVSIFTMVKDNAAKAGVTKVISPHSFRHSFATHLVENGADLRVVQEMLGHESILTTEIYTHIDTRKWQETILNFHPANAKKY